MQSETQTKAPLFSSELTLSKKFNEISDGGLICLFPVKLTMKAIIHLLLELHDSRKILSGS